VLVFGAGLTLFLLYFNGKVLPAANFAFKTHHFNILKKQANVAIRERVFVDKFEGYRFYIDRRGADGSFEDVKAFNRFAPGSPLQTTLAKRGTLESDPGTFRVFFKLGQGVMTWDNSTFNTYNRLYFENYVIHLKLGNRLAQIAELKKNFEDMSSEELARGGREEADPGRRRSFAGEYQKRLSLPFSCLAMAWFCSCLGLWIRSRGFMSFVLGIVMIFIYYLMFTLGQALSERGVIGAIPGLWGANAALALAGTWVYILVVRENAGLGGGRRASAVGLRGTRGAP
jgi:lipopolysaccharide export LptBFGC system permease protein LptF